MALEVSLNSAYGVNLTYHKVTSVEYDYVTNSGAVKIASYPDKSTRLGDWAPVSYLEMYIHDMKELSLEAIYKAVKSSSEIFKEAKDV
jgi:hypothetical protein